MEHLSNKEIEDIINKGLENRKAIFFSPLEIERIYNDALGSEDFEIMRLNLIQFETYLDGLMLKVLRPPNTKAKQEQLSALESMKSTLNEISYIFIISKIQSKIISDFRYKCLRLEKE